MISNSRCFNNFHYLDHICSINYDELTNLAQVFDMQVKALNQTISTQNKNEDELLQLWIQVDQLNERMFELDHYIHLIVQELDKLDNMVTALDKLPMDFVKDDRSKMYSFVNNHMHMDQAFQEFDAEYKEYWEVYKKMNAFSSLLDCHIEILTNIEKLLNTTDEALKEVESQIEKYKGPK